MRSGARVKRLALPAAAALALLLAACQGSGLGSGGGFGSGGGLEPPVNGSGPMPGQGGNGAGYPGEPSPFGTPTPSPPPGDANAYPFAQVQQGWTCPEVSGFTCTLRFNLPPATPTPAPGKHTPAPTPSPTPTPTPPPDDGSATPTPSQTPEGGFVNILLSALPKTAPAMVNPDPHAITTTSLLSLQLRSDTTQTLQGRAILDFTLPKSEIPDRGFALQLFHQMNVKGKIVNTFVASYSKSTVKDATLRFDFTLPAITVVKNETWLLVLYGDDLPKKSAAPSPSPSASASPASSSVPSSSPSAAP